MEAAMAEIKALKKLINVSPIEDGVYARLNIKKLRILQKQAAAELAELEKMQSAFSKFALVVFATAIMGIADAALVPNQEMNETHALRAVQELAQENIRLRAELKNAAHREKK
jgi:hypothetical protein